VEGGGTKWSHKKGKPWGTLLIIAKDGESIEGKRRETEPRRTTLYKTVTQEKETS